MIACDYFISIAFLNSVTLRSYRDAVVRDTWLGTLPFEIAARHLMWSATPFPDDLGGVHRSSGSDTPSMGSETPSEDEDGYNGISYDAQLMLNPFRDMDDY